MVKIISAITKHLGSLSSPPTFTRTHVRPFTHATLTIDTVQQGLILVLPVSSIATGTYTVGL
jgi:hypothetical protein